MYEFLADLGDEARERPAPTLRGSVVAAAAVLAMIGLIAIAIDSSDSETNVVGIILGVLAAGAGHGILVALPARVRPAGIALIALGSATALVFLFDDVDSPQLPLFLLAVAFLAQWVVGPARGAAALLTLGLLSTWALLIDLVSSDGSSSTSVLSLTDEIDLVPNTPFTNGGDTVAYVSLIVGIGLLLATRTLDGRKFHGTATSAVIVGDIAFLVGVFGVVSTFDEDAGGSIIIIVAGLVLAFVGAGGTRRVTTWLGGIGVLIGLLSLLTTAVDITDPTQFGVVSVIVGAGIIAGFAYIQTPERAAVPAAEPADAAAVVDTAVEPDEESSAAFPETPPVSVEPEQGWHADPSGRHQLRWHDGSSWTNHVSDEGETSTDEGV